MKKAFAMFLVTLLMFTLCACGKDGGDTAETYTKQESALSDIFTNAELLYSWFTGCNHISADEADTRMVGDDVYCRVTQTGYTTCDELRTALSRYFTDDVVTRLMNTTVYNDRKLFQDFDGALYTYDNFVGLVRWDIGERVGHITEQDAARMVYHLEINYLYYNSSFAAQYDYEYILCEDGQWRFSSFALPAELIGQEMFGFNDTNEEE